MVNLYDTLTKTIKTIQPQGNERIRLYSCGPTVHNHAHIGNLRSFIIPDILYRTLKAQGQPVEWVMNITDIDDKTILGAIAEYGQEATVENLQHFTKKYTDGFIEDMRKVNVSVDEIKIIPVTSVMPQIQAFIMELADKGLAYKADDGSTYFSIEKYQEQFGDYGALIGDKFLEGKKISARVNNDEYDKDNLSDFALWKAHNEDDANIFWHHEALGKGRPGWHIECSVINRVAFGGKATDIHTGGVDLIFPHHTNEIAQSQPFGPFVHHWMHLEHIQIDNKKMSKRYQNFFTLKDIEEKGFTGSDLRYLFLQSHYKTQQNFTWDALQAAHNAVEKLSEHVQDTAGEINDHFLQALNDDLNIPQALATVWEDKENVKSYDAILGLNLQKPGAVEVPEEIQKLLDERQRFRDEKNFAKSDELRDMIEKLGYEIKDTAEGQQIKKAWDFTLGLFQWVFTPANVDDEAHLWL